MRSAIVHNSQIINIAGAATTTVPASLKKNVPSHRPPYDDNHHISGYNLFVSAYHGFAQLGHEHVPVPQPYPLFPPSSLELLTITCSNGMGTIRCRLTLTATDTPDRWHVSAKVQFTGQGVSPNPSSMHTYMGRIIKIQYAILMPLHPFKTLQRFYRVIIFAYICSISRNKPIWAKNIS